MKSILKKINSKLFLLFLCGFFSITAQAQWGEDGGNSDSWQDNSGNPDLNGPEWEGGATVNNDYHDPTIDYGNLINPYNYGENDITVYDDDDDDDYNDVTQNSSDSTLPSQQEGQNIIDKPVITKQELSKLIQDLKSRYDLSSKRYVLTTSDGKSVTGIILRLKDSKSEHSFYYFTPYTNSGTLKTDNYYKIPEPKSSGPTNTNSNINITIPIYLDSFGMPSGFQTIETGTGNQPIFMESTNDYDPEPYCQGCSQIDFASNPKYPTLLKLFPEIKKLVLNNPKILSSFQNASGYSLQDTMNFLTEGIFKKLIRSADIITNGLFERSLTPYFVFVRQDLITSLETGGYKQGYNENLNSTSFFVAITILHELVHYARYWNGLPVDITREGKEWEAGAVFESDIFKHTLTIDTAKYYAKEYGWNF